MCQATQTKKRGGGGRREEPSGQIEDKERLKNTGRENKTRGRHTRGRVPEKKGAAGERLKYNRRLF